MVKLKSPGSVVVNDLGVWMVWRGAVPVVSPSLLVFYHLDPLVQLDVVLAGQQVEEVRPDPAQHRQPVLGDRQGKLPQDRERLVPGPPRSLRT